MDTRKLSVISAVALGLSLAFGLVSFILNILRVNSYPGVNSFSDSFISIMTGALTAVFTAGMIVTLILNNKKYFFSIPTAARTLPVFISFIFNILTILKLFGNINFSDLISAYPNILIGWVITLISSLLSLSGYIMLAMLGICFSVENFKDKYLNYIWFIPGIFLGLIPLLAIISVLADIIVPALMGYDLVMSSQSILSLTASFIGIISEITIAFAALVAGKWSVTAASELEDEAAQWHENAT